MKKALIGLSTPIGYSYRNNIEKLKGQPNPIIDSPIGLFLFYDELWFVNRRTCPINCQNLSYVKFLDEEYDLSKLNIEQFCWENSEIEKHVITSLEGIKWSSWTDAIERNLKERKQYVDSHGRSFNLGNLNASPRPTPINLLIDDFLANQFNLELITNTVTNQYALTTKKFENTEERILTQYLLCENIPSFQLELGPYHELIEDIRSDKLIKNFRNKMTSVLSSNETKSIETLKENLEKEMTNYLHKLIIKQVDQKRIIKGSSSVIFGQVPILSNVYSGLEGGAEVYNGIKDRKTSGWMAFIAKVKQRIN